MPKACNMAEMDVDEVNSYNQEPGTQNEVEVCYFSITWLSTTVFLFQNKEEYSYFLQITRPPYNKYLLSCTTFLQAS